MKIFPAIDIINGHCVRLTEGDYEQKKIYHADPVAVAKNFEAHGFQYLHVVDLDGAKSGKPENLKLIHRLAEETNLKIELGGGIRNFKTAEAYLKSGVWRLIFGSAAVKNPDFFINCLKNFGKQKIVLGLDLKNGKIAISGWQESTDITPESFLDIFFSRAGDEAKNRVQTVLVTDISKDGKLQGPNFQLYQKLMTAFPALTFIASGGISDIRDVKKLKENGVQEIIVGKAIYEGKVTLEELKSLDS